MQRPDSTWWLVGGVTAVLFVSAIVPTGGAVARSGPLGLVGLDLWLHAFAYCLLQWVVLVAVDPDTTGRLSRRVMPLFVVGYGVFLEGVQLGLPYRHASAVDVLANILGVCIALAGWTLLRRKH